MTFSYFIPWGDSKLLNHNEYLTFCVIVIGFYVEKALFRERCSFSAVRTHTTSNKGGCYAPIHHGGHHWPAAVRGYHVHEIGHPRLHQHRRHRPAPHARADHGSHHLIAILRPPAPTRSRKVKERCSTHEMRPDKALLTS
jgi:hypothetical protein